jgi:uncharacterized protein involved in exopolysaccharide biosynthesis
VREPLTDSDYSLVDYLVAVYRRAWVVLLVTAVAAGTAWLVSKRAAPVYEAYAAFFVPRDVESSIGLTSEHASARLPSGSENEARAYAKILQQPDAYVAALRKVPDKNPARIERDIDVIATREAVIRVYSRDPNPRVAADVANALVDYFNDFQLQLIREMLERSIKKIEAQIALVEEELKKAQAERQAMLESNRIVLLPKSTEQLEGDRNQLSMQLAQSRVRMSSITDQLLGLERQMAEEAKRYGGSQLLDSREGSFYNQLRQRKSLLEVDQRGLDAEIRQLSTAIEAIDRTIRAGPAMLSQFAAIDDRYATLRQDRDRFESTLRELKTQSLDLRSPALVVRAATPPKVPSFPKKSLNVIIGAVAGFLAGVALALMIEAFDRQRRWSSPTASRTDEPETHSPIDVSEP